MQLPTYRRINIKSKRLGIETDDIIWLPIGAPIGLVIFSLLGLPAFTGIFAGFGAMYAYFGLIKPRRPRGWLKAILDFRTAPQYYIARHEWRDNL